jgi:hypothetical protein
MATEGKSRRPYATAVELTAAAEPELIEPQPEPARQRWLKPLSSYDRRESSWIHGARFG